MRRTMYLFMKLRVCVCACARVGGQTLPSTLHVDYRQSGVLIQPPFCLVMAMRARTHTRTHVHAQPLELTANGHEAAFCREQEAETRQQPELINRTDVRITECRRENKRRWGKKKKK